MTTMVAFPPKPTRQRSVFFGDGSVVVRSNADGDVRKLAISADKLMDIGGNTAMASCGGCRGATFQACAQSPLTLRSEIVTKLERDIEGRWARASKEPNNGPFRMAHFNMMYDEYEIKYRFALSFIALQDNPKMQFVFGCTMHHHPWEMVDSFSRFIYVQVHHKSRPPLHRSPLSSSTLASLQP